MPMPLPSLFKPIVSWRPAIRVFKRALSGKDQSVAKLPDRLYRCPTDLGITTLRPKRVIIIGSCLASAWPAAFATADTGCPADFLLFNNFTQLADKPPRPVEDYDFQVVQLPIRSIVPDHSYFRLPYDDVAAYESLLKDAKSRLSQFLSAALRWNTDHGLLTFVCNFLVPQQNPMGRLLPRYDLRNFVYFVEQLNQALADELTQYRNAYLLDIDQLVSTYGRRYFQDDAVCQLNHGGALSNSDFAHDQQRLEQVPKMTVLYGIRNHEYLMTIWNELIAMYRTIRQVDMVKLVILDIDDTLWRGVAAEAAGSAIPEMAGWPIGLAETLGYLKRRGVLLAVASKNDEGLVRKMWNDIMGQHLSLDDFAALKVNWRPKAENIQEILRDMNLLPRNVLFVDDNPVERAAVQAIFPELRVLGSNPYVWRRILLWSSETQVTAVTQESAGRNDMMRAQVERENQRQQMSRDNFLASLSLQFAWREITAKDADFTRAFELLNKTNQFNTTGRRWSDQELRAALANGSKLVVFRVKDRFTAYGLVGVLILGDSGIKQFVMSCRVAGMDVEIAAIAETMRYLRKRGAQVLEADFAETELNLLCRDVYARCGFSQVGGKWQRSLSPELVIPTHIELVKNL